MQHKSRDLISIPHSCRAVNGPAPSDSTPWWFALRSAHLSSWRSSCCHHWVNITSSSPGFVHLTGHTSTHPLTALEVLPGTLLTANISACVKTHGAHGEQGFVRTSHETQHHGDQPWCIGKGQNERFKSGVCLCMYMCVCVSAEGFRAFTLTQRICGSGMLTSLRGANDSIMSLLWIKLWALHQTVSRLIYNDGSQQVDISPCRKL